MYQLTRARGREHRRNSRWRSIDVAQMPIHTVSARWGDVWFFVTYPGFEGERALRLSSLVNDLSKVQDPSLTVQQWLTQQGNRTLPFAERLPTFTPRFVRYSQAWHRGFQIDALQRKGTVERQVSKFERPDLKLTHRNIDSQTLGQYGLFTVNGLFHCHDTGKDGVYLLNGNQTIRQMNDNQVGLYSFQDVGTLQCYPIQSEWVSPQRPEAPLYHGAYLTIPGDVVSLQGKTCLLVIGGYLQALDEGYIQTGPQRFRVELQRLCLPERYYDSREALALNDLGIEPYGKNDGMVGLSQFFSDEVLRRYLTMAQSFLVVVDTPTMFSEREAIEPAMVPNRYFAPGQWSQWPLYGAYGRALEYHAIHEDGMTVLATSPNYRHRYDFNTRNFIQDGVIDNGRYPGHPVDPAGAFIRYLGTEDDTP